MTIQQRTAYESPCRYADETAQGRFRMVRRGRDGRAYSLVLTANMGEE